MKRHKKNYLKSIKTSGFKWDTDPIAMYQLCEGDGLIQLSKRDLKKLIDIAILRHENNQRIIKSLNHQLGF